MEVSGGGILGRLSEKVIGWIVLGLLIFLGIAIYRMPAETKTAIWNGIWRSAVWVAIVAATPWSVKLFIRRILEAGTNWAGAALLAGLVAVDVVAALILMTGWPGSAWTWVAALGALAVAGAYNYLVTEYLSDMAGP